MIEILTGCAIALSIDDARSRLSSLSISDTMSVLIKFAIYFNKNVNIYIVQICSFNKCMKNAEQHAPEIVIKTNQSIGGFVKQAN